MSPEGRVFPVAFDEVAMAEDLVRLGEAGAEALAGAGREVDRLGGCVKTYVPWPAGRFGAVMVAVSHRERPLGLRVIAFGVRHQPRDAHALTVYEIADRRIHD